MCLSDVYISSRNDGNLLLRNIADIKIEGDILVMTDIMGIPRQLKATV
ncbi:MAG: CooT family nickel-binding protein, partial [Firmicutes bacterium]|nr:CooT family nickel-binding protein [Bacillota bacterium]